jgi:AAA ATPase domain
VQPSPYTPGEVAREVPGRAVQLAQMDERLSYMIDLQRLVGRVRVDVAARGIGKTSMLREAQRRAQARGAMTIWVTAGESQGLTAAIAREIGRAANDWKDEARGRLPDLLERLTVSLGVPGVARVEATWGHSEPRPPQGVREFEDAVRATVTGAQHEGHRGVVIFIDEIQSADDEGLRTLAYGWQHLQTEGSDLPVAVFAAGLPNSPEVIADVVTFSERFAYRPLDRLSVQAAQIALGAPARALGVAWNHDALDHAVQIAQGYPYTLQLLGDATWAAAGYPNAGTQITDEHVRYGERAIQSDLAALFRARWEKATTAEQRFMRAMAGLGDGPVRRGDIAAAVGATSDELSVPRARLIDKGLVEVAGRGELDFTIPGFAEYVRSRTDSDF